MTPFISKNDSFLKFASCFIILIFMLPSAFAQSIPITGSIYMNDIVFDGKWTFLKEWKASSLDIIERIYIRSAHLDNFIYIHVNAVPDTSIDKGEDFTILCFDSKKEQNVKPDSNDYCFIAKLGTNNAVTLQGSEESGEFVVIKNHDDLIAIGAASDENDRYSKVPHASYEFRIPIDLLERTDVYGFYVGIFDYSKSYTTTFPQNIDVENTEIPSPSKWGIIFSPDKSLPEYDLPILVLLLGTFSIILFSWKNKKLNLFYLYR